MLIICGHSCLLFLYQNDGCTAVVVLINNDTVVCSNVGDSRAVMSRLECCYFAFSIFFMRLFGFSKFKYSMRILIYTETQ